MSIFSRRQRTATPAERFDEIERKLEEAFAEAQRQGDEALAQFGDRIRQAEREQVQLNTNYSLGRNESHLAMRAAVTEAKFQLDRKNAYSRLDPNQPLDTAEALRDRLNDLRHVRDYLPTVYRRERAYLDGLRDELATAVQAWYDNLAEHVISDAKAYDTLKPFMADQNGRAERLRYEAFDIFPTVDCDRWNDAVAKWEEDPLLSDFAGLDSSASSTKILLMAAVTVQKFSFTAARIVEAYCRAYQSHHEAVGGYLRQLLALQVARHQMDRSEV